MKGIILNSDKERHTYLKKIFFGLGDQQKNYNWLITDHECYPQTEKYEKKLSGDYCWLSGLELSDMVTNEDFQWIWGVLSAFSPKVSQEEALKYPLPIANGYKGFWRNPLSIQHPLAAMELVAWDSSLTLFISKDHKLLETFTQNFPLAKDLESYNMLL